MTHTATSGVLSERIRQLAEWLDEAAPYVQFDQRHLDGGTPEQAYWHLGYRTAMLDVLALIQSDTESKSDTANRSQAASRDE